MLPILDCAYQGFATGNADDDAWAVRHFVDVGFDMLFVAQSYAKNFGLYGERAGCLHVVAPSSAIIKPVLSQLERLQRVSISTPPAYGARIVSAVLNDPNLHTAWLHDLRTMAGRMIAMRQALRRLLEDSSTGKWKHLTDQVGMFCYTGLDRQQVQQLRDAYHIYMTADGRMNVSGLNNGNVQYVAQAIRAVTLKARL